MAKNSVLEFKTVSIPLILNDALISGQTLPEKEVTGTDIDNFKFSLKYGTIEDSTENDTLFVKHFSLCNTNHHDQNQILLIPHQHQKAYHDLDNFYKHGNVIVNSSSKFIK